LGTVPNWEKVTLWDTLIRRERINMEKLKLNETPVRTSKNFNINNIKLENIEVPEIVHEFNNVQIINNSSNLNINENVSDFNIAYGLHDNLTNLVKNKANKKIKLQVNENEDKEVQIEFKFDKNNTELVENIQIEAERNSKMTIIIKYDSEEDIKAFHNGIINVVAKENATVNIVIVNLMNKVSNNFMSIQNDFEENAKVNYTIVDFGGKNSITNYYSNLLGDFSDNTLNTIYLGKEDQLFDLNYIAELRGKKTNIDIEVQGALKDKAKKHFKGTIDFKKGCKKATGNENEACMLLSDTARSLALPMLLCSEEEVEGNHSSSAGKIGEKELFYIMSRGFELKEAMKLMVRARFNEILERIENEELKNQIIDEIEKRLD